MTNKERILVELLNGEKSTGELCKALGYVKNKIPQYKVIERDLKTLYSQGFLSRRKGKTGGRPGTFWGIKANLSNLRRILDRYPTLGNHMQNSDLVLNAIIEAYAPVYGIHSKEREHWKKFFRNALRLSWNFFKLHLYNEPEKFSDALIIWFKEYEPHTRIAFDFGITNPELHYVPELLLKELFERCVFIDFIDEKVNSAELEYRKLDSKDKMRTDVLFEKVNKYDNAMKFLMKTFNLFKEDAKKEIQKFIEESQKEFWELRSNDNYTLSKGLEFFAGRADELDELLIRLGGQLEPWFIIELFATKELENTG